MWWVPVLCSLCSCGGGLSAGEGHAAKSPPICESTLRYQELFRQKKKISGIDSGLLEVFAVQILAVLAFFN
jgi:hypothetical protein